MALFLIRNSCGTDGANAPGTVQGIMNALIAEEESLDQKVWNLLQTAGFCLFHSHLTGTELCLLGGSKVSSSLEYKFVYKLALAVAKTRRHTQLL